MKYETHDNGYLVNCINCDHKITYLDEDHHYCSECGFPIRNECIGTRSYIEQFTNGPLPHDFEENVFLLKPEDSYCPKCASPSLFAVKNLIEVKHPVVEIITHSTFKDDDLPY